MAVYPVLPEHRFDWHRDGSVGLLYTVGAGTTAYLSAAEMADLNDEDTGEVLAFGVGSGAESYAVCVYFAEPMTLYGGFFAWGRNNTAFASFDAAEYSTDSTAPTNGGWTAWDAGTWNSPGGVQRSSDVHPYWRNQYSVLGTPIPDVTAVRYRFTSAGFSLAVSALHLYAAPSNGWGDRAKLRIWHPTLDQILAANDLDFGDPAVGTTELRPFRVKNHLAFDLTDVTVGLEVLTDASPSLTTQFDLSLDGSTFDSDVVLGDLAAAAISDLVYLRRHTSLAAMMDVRGLWLVATGAY